MGAQNTVRSSEPGRDMQASASERAYFHGINVTNFCGYGMACVTSAACCAGKSSGRLPARNGNIEPHLKGSVASFKICS